MRSPLVACLASVCLVLGTMVPAGGIDSCINCHGNEKVMRQAGYARLTVTRAEVKAQSGMPADCADCHLGNPEATDKETAHKGLARMLVVRSKGLAADPAPRAGDLEFGANPTNRLFIVRDAEGKRTRDPSVAAILWQDKRRDTLTQDFPAMEKTCGKCHPDEFAEFGKSVMGTNGKQSRYRGWTDERRGPHNCGPWFEGNFDKMQANTAVPMSRQSHDLNQKVCNTCHVGCLDCHYNPQPKNPADPSMGSHTFVKTPPPLSCYGNGRGSVCHAGPEDRRRGAGYFGGSFSFPEGSAPDAHFKVGVGCLDCHASTRSDKSMGHGMVRRQAGDSCVRCHQQTVKSNRKSIHRNVSCEACHIRDVGGYQGTYWGPGRIAGAYTPFFKYKAYYGIMAEPILIKDQKGRWIPVKPFPMAALNQETAPFRKGLMWRYPAGLPPLERTDDAWAFTGLYGGMPENNNALTWIQMDKMSHKLGKGRNCDSCHLAKDGSQRQKVSWEYGDPGAAPFRGGHVVTANARGLFITDIRNEDKIELQKGYTLSSFAPWIYLKDVWQVKGDFSLPVIRDRRAYERMKSSRAGALAAGALHR